jgi:DNA mismatch repair protein MutS
MGPAAEGQAPTVRFQGILFDRATGDGAEEMNEPSALRDMNLDQVFEALAAGREEYGLEPFFHAPLRDVGAVRYRHEVFRDLERKEVLQPVDVFAQTMRIVRRRLAQAEKLYYRRQKERWFLDAVDIYCQAITSLADELEGQELASRGLRGFREYLADYRRSIGFTSLVAETEELKDALGSVHYCIHIKGNRVTLNTYDGEPDYSTEVEETFAKFKQGAVKDYRVRLPDPPEMNHVEAQAMEIVARLYPDVFTRLGECCVRHGTFIDDTIRAFDREVQFYLGYLEYIERFRSAGLPFCYPQVSARSKNVCAEDAFDLALANKLVPERSTVVRNDFHLDDPERILVVTGPNQGGKTTFARMFGQLHYLASLGYPVPGRSARLFLPDRLFTHFERREDLATLRGKLEDELARLHEILQQATSDSIIVLNESFTSTTLRDSLFLGTEVARRIIRLGSLAVYVTFVDEVASLSDSTVSMVATVVPDNPAVRTYRIVRKPADGPAYAAALAEKYGLGYESLRRRMGP